MSQLNGKSQIPEYFKIVASKSVKVFFSKCSGPLFFKTMTFAADKGYYYWGRALHKIKIGLVRHEVCLVSFPATRF